MLLKKSLRNNGKYHLLKLLHHGIAYSEQFLEQKHMQILGND